MLAPPNTSLNRNEADVPVVAYPSGMPAFASIRPRATSRRGGIEARASSIDDIGATIDDNFIHHR
jgi:hypothetical protein